jgi:cytochrome bd ubiquinol oxidase subunit I
MTSVLAGRWQFAFTITYHYLFPQLTMGLALLIFILKTMALRTGNPHYERAALFWAKIFGISFAMGVVTGIPMEFQFGTNWSRFSAFAGNIIGQTLAMEGVFAFFLESSFLGVFLYGRNKVGPRGHWFASLMLFVGSWISGWFIIATNAFMQNPVGYTAGPAGELQLQSFWALMFNPWLRWQYLHNMCGATATGSFVMAGIGAWYLLGGRHTETARTFVRLGVIAGTIAVCLLLFPTGDIQARNVADKNPVALAAMEGLFDSAQGAPLALVGQPDMERLKLDNPIAIPNVLSFLTYRRWYAKIEGLKAYPRDLWPDNVPLLYFSYHIMVGLGTIFIAGMLCCLALLRGGRLYRARPALWLLLVLTPFPYVANTAGWMTAELGRQPWVVRGLLRTADANSAQVSEGNGLFSLLGFMGLYTLLSILFLYLVHGVVERGPEPETAPAPPAGSAE